MLLMLALSHFWPTGLVQTEAIIKMVTEFGEDIHDVHTIIFIGFTDIFAVIGANRCTD